MARPKSKAPALRYHISGQSVVTIDGKDYYLGKHNSPESLARYAVLIGIYQNGGLRLPEDFDQEELDARAASLMFSAPVAQQQAEEPILVRHVTASYREHVKVRYAASPAELHRLNQVCDELDKHDGDRQADDYGPLAIQRQRQRWIDGGNARVYCNRLTNCVIRVFKYAVSQELAKTETWQRLRSVEP